MISIFAFIFLIQVNSFGDVNQDRVRTAHHLAGNLCQKVEGDLTEKTAKADFDRATDSCLNALDNCFPNYSKTWRNNINGVRGWCAEASSMITNKCDTGKLEKRILEFMSQKDILHLKPMNYGAFCYPGADFGEDTHPGTPNQK